MSEPANLSQAEWFFLADDPEVCSDELDLVLDDLGVREVQQVGGAREVGRWWATKVGIGQPDEDGLFEDYETKLFETEEEARLAAGIPSKADLFSPQGVEP